MTIYQRMREVFRLADVPGFFQAWRRTEECPELPDTYAVYNMDRERSVQSADDQPIFWRYNITIFVYGLMDLSEVVEAIEDALTMERFELPTSSDAYARINGAHIYAKQINTAFVDYGEYGPD